MIKWGKSTDQDQNLIISEVNQDTPACQISGHSSHEFSRKCPKKQQKNVYNWVEMLLKWGKSTDCNQKLISSEGGEATLICQILRHTSNAWSRICPETPKLTHFTKANCWQNLPKWGKSTGFNGYLDQNESILRVVRIHQHAKIRPYPPRRSSENVRKPQRWPVSLMCDR